jgi:parvulin-like peptidyl-prolyl isomerase
LFKCKIGGFYTIFVLLFSILLTGQQVCADENVDTQKGVNEDDYFAIINQQTISATEYVYRFRKSLQEKFFHGKVSDEELDTFKKQVAEKLVLEVLLDQEARRRGLQPDASKITQELDALDKKFSNAQSAEEREAWEENRNEALPILKARIEREALMEQLQERVKKIAQPPRDDVKKYYEDNKDKFTEPQQWDVSMILLPVDPSSSPEVWEETVEKAEKILQKTNKGESFEELARIHSGDESAVNGGHMGYMHIGMFGTPAQKVLNVMEPGEISEPVVLLEGVALFRLNDVQEASLNTFGDVEERARNLLMRELGEKAWKDLQTALRQSADIKYSDLIIEDLNLNMTSDNAS